VADVFDVVVPFPVKLFFEGEDDEHFVDVGPNLFYPVLFPGPDLGRYIIDDPEALPAGPFGDTHVEPRIVDKDEGIGGVAEDVGLAEVYVAEDGAEVHQHFGESHEGEVFVVFDQVAAGLLHQVASPAPNVGRGVLFLQLSYQIAAVQVT